MAGYRRWHALSNAGPRLMPVWTPTPSLGHLLIWMAVSGTVSSTTQISMAVVASGETPASSSASVAGNSTSTLATQHFALFGEGLGLKSIELTIPKLNQERQDAKHNV